MMLFTKYFKSNLVFCYSIKTLLYIFVKIKNIFHRHIYNDSILIIALHRLGDAVFTIPAIRRIVNFHKNNIYLICFAETEPIYKIVFDSINFLSINHEDFFLKDRLAKRQLKRLINNLRSKIAYDMTGTITSASILVTCKAEKIIGINEIYFSPLYTNFKPIRKKPHITDNYLDGIKDILPSFDLIQVKNVQKEVGSCVMIHPFTSLKEKEWGIKNYFSLACKLNQKFNCVIVSPKDKIKDDIKSEIIKNSIDLIETATVEELVRVIQQCSLFIGNDSGPTNIATLLDKPTFIIYGPTNPSFHKPLTHYSDHIIKHISCSPNLDEKMCAIQSTTKTCPSFECMNNLSPIFVYKRLSEFIQNLEKQFLIKPKI